MDDKVYVIGGWNGQRGLTRCDVFDPQTNDWSEIASLSTGDKLMHFNSILINCVYFRSLSSWCCSFK